MIHILIGTRAQLIKMAPVLLAFERTATPFRLVLSGQHRVTMAALLSEFGVRTPPVSLYEGEEITGIAQMARWFPRVLWRAWRDRARLFPRGVTDCMVVHGDTVSTLLGALLGRLLRMQVAHVESGLTSGRWREPFPEELTRRLVFRLCDIAFCPDAWSTNHMRGRAAEVVDTGGNTIFDAVEEARARFAEVALEPPPAPYAVVSLHRFENIFEAERFGFIVTTLERMAERLALVFVLHPATRRQAEKFGLLARLENHPRIRLEARMTYVPFLKLLCGARFVVSDGGSNQEELAWLGIPTLLMRDTTERRDGLEEGVVLSHYDPAVIERFVSQALEGAPPRRPRRAQGRPALLIAARLAAKFSA